MDKPAARPGAYVSDFVVYQALLVSRQLLDFAYLARDDFVRVAASVAIVASAHKNSPDSEVEAHRFPLGA